MRRSMGKALVLTAAILGFIPTMAEAQLIISEFRVRGPNGANDEFIEIYNNSGADHTVAGGGTGYAVAASNGVARCVIPNGTVIPNRGHYLCVNSVGYSLASYPAGQRHHRHGRRHLHDRHSGQRRDRDLQHQRGRRLHPREPARRGRLDERGEYAYKEGAGYPALTPFSIDYSFYRDDCGKSGSITTMGACTHQHAQGHQQQRRRLHLRRHQRHVGRRRPAAGRARAGEPLVADSAQRLVRRRRCSTRASRRASPPNRVRDFTSDPANNSTFGTLDIRRTFTNNTGGNVTRLRFRVIDITTFPAPSGIADLRPRTSTAVVVTVDRPPCGSGTSNVTVQGTTLEQPPSQPNGGGFNRSA